MAGLAEQSAGMGQGAMQPKGPSTAMGVEEVAQLLMQGVEPEELLEQGIPAEVIQQAIQMLMQQAQQQSAQPAQTATGRQMQGGLAQQASGRM